MVNLVKVNLKLNSPRGKVKFNKSGINLIHNEEKQQLDVENIESANFNYQQSNKCRKQSTKWYEAAANM